jgi:hypothetical protein
MFTASPVAGAAVLLAVPPPLAAVLPLAAVFAPPLVAGLSLVVAPGVLVPDVPHAAMRTLRITNSDPNFLRTFIVLPPLDNIASKGERIAATALARMMWLPSNAKLAAMNG